MFDWYVKQLEQYILYIYTVHTVHIIYIYTHGECCALYIYGDTGNDDVQDAQDGKE